MAEIDTIDFASIGLDLAEYANGVVKEQEELGAPDHLDAQSGSEPEELISTEEPLPQKEEVAPPSGVVEEEFDYSAPLNPRERQLLERLERITGEKLELQPPQPEVAREEPPTPTVGVDFLEGVDLDEVFSSKENFNKLLGSVYARAMEDAAKLSAENVMRSLPATISNYTSQHLKNVRIVDDFYASNQDLVGVKRTVAAVANEISTEHPEYTLEQLFGEAAKKTREILKISTARTTTPPPKERRRTPTLPGQGASSVNRTPVPQMSQIETDILDLVQ